MLTWTEHLSCCSLIPTLEACDASGADIGVMFDTDADRAGFVLPRDDDGSYEPLHKNRLIALLGVVFASSSPGCTFVTDSTTSEGLSAFLEDTLGLNHCRFLRGYANVIGKAKELTESGAANAQVAIETSGHCAMKENGYLDDGTYAAVKVIGLLARLYGSDSSSSSSLLDLISDLEEMPYEKEYRLESKDGSTATTSEAFRNIVQSVQDKCATQPQWTFDEDNLEGVRVRLASGGFFMARQSLHDPVISFQLESVDASTAAEEVVGPMMEVLGKHGSALDLGDLTLNLNP